MFIDCADYVAMVLHYADVVDVVDINSVNYHDISGLDELLTQLGWEQYGPEDAEPGDIGIYTGPGMGHAFVMWENDTIWDESIGQTDENGNHRNTGPYGFDLANCHFYRCPD